MDQITAMSTHLHPEPATPFPAIAVIGIGCRLPGEIKSPAAFWTLLKNNVDALGEFPPARRQLWPSHAGPPPQRGGFLSDVEQFDADFFRISPREAAYIDPQQRLLLEVSWDALAHAGINHSTLAGSDTGVFVGMFAHDYERMQAVAGAPSVYFGTGTACATASGRLSHFYDLRGPALTVDTASSASLAAVHLACQSLQCGESSLALAAGVNLILAPELSDCFTTAGMLSAEGRSRGFDAGASGYVRSEGCGVVILKRLSDALAAQDRILSVIRSTTANQDGASEGLTVPNGNAQQALMRRALRRAGLAPDDISYIEAHGSGTPVGDPIEWHALQAVFGAQRMQPLWVGSAKSNVGHLESAAGIVGLIKAVLSLHHQFIPAHLHYTKLHPALSDWGAQIPRTGQPWTVPAGVARRAGVSAFGFSGTNVHVVLEEAPVAASPESVAAPARSHELLTLCAHSTAGLQQLIGEYSHFLAHGPPAGWADICFTAQSEQRHHAHRVAVVADCAAAASSQLAAFAAGQMTSGVIHQQGRSSPSARSTPKLAFLYTGGGAQYLGMGQTLYRTSATFRQALDRCSELLRPFRARSLLEVIFADDASDAELHQVAYMQPALFALSYALTALWASWGVRPEVVLGHSTGEYAAACAAGVMSLEDAMTLVATRSQLMQTTAPAAIFALRATESQVIEHLRPYQDEVSIAVINGDSSLVISGNPESLHKALLAMPEIEATPIKVSCGPHSPLMDPILDTFERAAQKVSFAPPQLRFVSSTLGRADDAQIVTSHYWRRHIRDTVRFAAGIQSVAAESADLYIEIGPKPTLLTLGKEVLAGKGTWLPSLQPPFPEWEVLLRSLGELYVSGVAIDWQAVGREYAPARQRIALPSYPFSRQKHWIEMGVCVAKRPQATTVAASPQLPHERPLPTASAPVDPPQRGLLDELRQATTQTRAALVTDFVTHCVRQVLRLGERPLLATQPLRELGLDSLLATEITSDLDRVLHVNIPRGRIVGGASVATLTAIILEKLSAMPAFQSSPIASVLDLTPRPQPIPSATAAVDFHDVADEVPQIHAIVTEQQQRKIKIDGRWVFDFASCNYLGLDLHPSVIAEVLPALQKWGVHPSWTRAVASPEIYDTLETELAAFLKAPATLVFPAVTLLHAGVIPVLAGYDGVILRDISAHRSIFEGCIQAQAQGAEVIEFRHNDPADLEAKLARYPRERTKLIAIDGVYSMSGLYPPLPTFTELARKYNALVYLDDAHGIGVIGERPSAAMPYGHYGNGVVNHFGLDYVANRVIYVAGLSKSFSSYGAFVVCHDEQMKKHLRRASTFIFSGPAPVASLASALAGLRINRVEGEAWRAKILFLVQRLVNGAKAMGFEVINENYFPIVGVVIGTSRDVVSACKCLWEYGILITPALFPIVPIGRGLLRFSVTAANTEEEIDRSLEALAAVRKEISDRAYSHVESLTTLSREPVSA